MLFVAGYVFTPSVAKVLAAGLCGVVSRLLFLKGLKANRVVVVTVVILLLFNNGGVPRLVGNVNGNIGGFGSNMGKLRSSVGVSSASGGWGVTRLRRRRVSF